MSFQWKANQWQQSSEVELKAINGEKAKDKLCVTSGIRDDKSYPNDITKYGMFNDSPLRLRAFHN